MINRVRIIRKKRNFRQVDLASKVKRPVQIISFIENEKFVPDEQLKKKLARALNVNVQQIFPG